jgi:hypothetical protein
MDIFIEQLITKKPDFRSKVIKIAILGVAAALSAFCVTAFLFGMVAAIVIIPGIIWVANHFSKSLNVEYEYILTNKDLDIDKIIGKSKRKRMVSLNLNNAEKLSVYDDSAAIDADTTVAAHDNTFADMWYLLAKHDSHGKVTLLFNPNDAFVTKLNAALPSRARNKQINISEESNGSSTV